MDTNRLSKKIQDILNSQVTKEAEAAQIYLAYGCWADSEGYGGVANFLFRGQDELILLYIDCEIVSAEIRYECLHGGEDLFPHIYGAINLESVTDTLPFNPDENGLFVLPQLIDETD